MLTGKQDSRRNKVFAVLGSILAVGAGMPSPTATQAVRSAEGARITVENTAQAPAKPIANATNSTAPGVALRALLGMGDGIVNSSGCPPKVRGMSTYCHKMRRQNFRAGKTASFEAKRRA